jgi:hypothetical protein
MSPTNRPPNGRLPGREGLAAIMLAVAAIALLATTAFLKPAPRGLGTHQQFGLPPCTFRFLFGRPCPTCGMTTAWAHLVRGHGIEALKANVGGMLLGVAAMVGAPWLIVSATCGRWVGWVPRRSIVAWMGAVIVLLTLIQWGLRLASG